MSTDNISLKVECDDGFSLEDHRADPYIGVNGRFLIDGIDRDDSTEAIVKVRGDENTSDGFRATLLTITNETDNDYYRGFCRLDNGDLN